MAILGRIDGYVPVHRRKRKRPAVAGRFESCLSLLSYFDGLRISIEPLKVAPSSIAIVGATMLPATTPDFRTVTLTVA
jgi:hypothetical protein